MYIQIEEKLFICDQACSNGKLIQFPTFLGDLKKVNVTETNTSKKFLQKTFNLPPLFRFLCAGPVLLFETSGCILMF
jgi:hypothetical protein